MNNCQVCGTFDILEDGMCWWCIADANDPDPYVDDSLNEVSMGRFDDDPPEWSFNWLESWPVTPVVAGSSPVHSAT